METNTIKQKAKYKFSAVTMLFLIMQKKNTFSSFICFRGTIITTFQDTTLSASDQELGLCSLLLPARLTLRTWIRRQ
jgi:hypothetical protein